MAEVYADRIRAALDEPDGLLAADRVKKVVIEEFAEFDAQSRVHTTRYFNHSYLPDCVIEHSGPSGVATRPLFLRFRSDPEFYREDIEAVRDEDAIVFGIGDIPPLAVPEAGPAMSEAAQSRGTLVTDAEGLETFIERAPTAPLLRMASSAIMISGRGQLDRVTAAPVATRLQSGFAGAQELDESAVIAAGSVLKAILGDQQSDQLTSVMQVLWVGSGGDASQFPLPTPALGKLDDETVQFLLQQEAISDLAFWDRVARQISLKQLCRLDLSGYVPNLTALVQASGTLLRPRAVRVIPEEAGLLSEGLPRYYWAVEQRALTFKAPNLSVFVTELVEELPPASDKGRSIGLNDLRNRSAAYEVRIGQLKLVKGDRAVAYEAESQHADIIHDPDLADLAEALGPEARVKTAEALVSGNRLTMSFPTLTANSGGPGRFGLSDVLACSLGLLAGLELDEWRANVAPLLPQQGQGLDPQLFEDDSGG